MALLSRFQRWLTPEEWFDADARPLALRRTDQAPVYLDTAGLESVPGCGPRGFWPHERFVDGLKLKTEGLDREDDPAALFYSIPCRFNLGQGQRFDGDLELSGRGHFKEFGDGGKDQFERSDPQRAVHIPIPPKYWQAPCARLVKLRRRPSPILRRRASIVSMRRCSQPPAAATMAERTHDHERLPSVVSASLRMD